MKLVLLTPHIKICIVKQKYNYCYNISLRGDFLYEKIYCRFIGGGYVAWRGGGSCRMRRHSVRT